METKLVKKIVSIHKESHTRHQTCANMKPSKFGIQFLLAIIWIFSQGRFWLWNFGSTLKILRNKKLTNLIKFFLRRCKYMRRLCKWPRIRCIIWFMSDSNKIGDCRFNSQFGSIYKYPFDAVFKSIKFITPKFLHAKSLFLILQCASKLIYHVVKLFFFGLTLVL